MVSAFALGAFAEVAISAIGFPFWTAGLKKTRVNTKRFATERYRGTRKTANHNRF
jgi:hypothetical protein